MLAIKLKVESHQHKKGPTNCEALSISVERACLFSALFEGIDDGIEL